MIVLVVMLVFSVWGLYHPKPVKNLGKSAQEITKEDIKGHEVVILLAGISNDPFGDLILLKFMIQHGNML